jgi:hypothetical protein
MACDEAPSLSNCHTHFNTIPLEAKYNLSPVAAVCMYLVEKGLNFWNCEMLIQPYRKNGTNNLTDAYCETTCKSPNSSDCPHTTLSSVLFVITNASSHLTTHFTVQIRQMFADNAQIMVRDEPSIVLLTYLLEYLLSNMSNGFLIGPKVNFFNSCFVIGY